MDSTSYQLIGAVTATTLLVAAGAFLASLLATVYFLAGRCSHDMLKPVAIMWSLVTTTLVVQGWLIAQRAFLGLLPTSAVPYYPVVAFWAVALSVFGAVTWLAMNQHRWTEVIRRRKGQVGERIVARVLARGGYDALHDQYVSDGTGIVQVDHVVPVGGLVVAIETKHYGGDVIARGDAEAWSQRFEDKTSIAIPNPLRQSARHVEVLRRVAGPGVSGLVVFSSHTEFPAGMPVGVVGTDNLLGYLGLLAETNPATEASLENWARFKAGQAAQDRVAAKARHEAMLSRTASHRVAPVVIGMCKGCKGTDVKAAFKYSHYWRCRTCGTNTAMRAPEGYAIEELDGNVVARGLDGTIIMIEERARPGKAGGTSGPRVDGQAADGHGRQAAPRRVEQQSRLDA